MCQYILQIVLQNGGEWTSEEHRRGRSSCPAFRFPAYHKLSFGKFSTKFHAAQDPHGAQYVTITAMAKCG